MSAHMWYALILDFSAYYAGEKVSVIVENTTN